LEEISYNNGWLSKEDLKRIGNELRKNGYGQYLLRLAGE